MIAGFQSGRGRYPIYKLRFVFESLDSRYNGFDQSLVTSEHTYILY